MTGFAPRSVVSILIVDESTLLRYGLKKIIADELRSRDGIGSAIFGEAATAESGIAQFGKRSWEVVVLGLSLSTKGLALILECRRHLPDATVVALAENSEYAMRAIQAGASMCLPRTAPLFEIQKLFQTILRGPRASNGNTGAASGSRPPLKLSERERDVLAGIAEGKRISELASEFSLDVRTVSTYRQRGMKKLGIQSTAALVHHVSKYGLH